MHQLTLKEVQLFSFNGGGECPTPYGYQNLDVIMISALSTGTLFGAIHYYHSGALQEGLLLIPLYGIATTIITGSIVIGLNSIHSLGKWLDAPVLID